MCFHVRASLTHVLACLFWAIPIPDRKTPRSAQIRTLPTGVGGSSPLRVSHLFNDLQTIPHSCFLPFEIKQDRVNTPPGASVGNFQAFQVKKEIRRRLCQLNVAYPERHRFNDPHANCYWAGRGVGLRQNCSDSGSTSLTAVLSNESAH